MYRPIPASFLPPFLSRPRLCSATLPPGEGIKPPPTGGGYFYGMIGFFGVGTAVPLAVPDKIFGLTLFLDFIDRGAINQLALSAIGSAR